ncbi:hypothetical protein CEXT_260651 [Caerostris extrusa]|uniref:Uncharacterized protein n=1 Tax=Caerostris extrusa TaxID=172846 RepID=A0AAV4XW29_CAEEX|nr:hypothetical protein CEXT_260651 [Caerostris extrusa]
MNNLLSFTNIQKATRSKNRHLFSSPTSFLCKGKCNGILWNECQSHLSGKHLSNERTKSDCPGKIVKMELVAVAIQRGSYVWRNVQRNLNEEKTIRIPGISCAS